MIPRFLSFGPDDSELAALADGSLEPRRRAALEARVAASPELSDLLAEQQRAVALARNAAAEVEAPAALRARVDPRRRARLTRAPRRFVLIGVATAAAALAVVIGPALLDSETTRARFRAALGPTGLAPGATGDATLTKTTSGWRIELDTNGLPRRAGRQFYEVWLRNSADVLVPVGTFNEGRNVTLWAGVSPKRFTQLVVTRERDDGVQASSGETVLVGTVDAGSSS